MNRINVVGVLFVLLLLFEPCIGGYSCGDYSSQVVLGGRILVNESRAHLIVPSIVMPHDQDAVIYAPFVDVFYNVDATLRLTVESNFSSSHVLGRVLRTWVVVTRPGYSLFYRVVGKVFNFNRTDVGSVGIDYIDVPLVYRATENDEVLRVFVFARGRVFHDRKVIDVVCHYSESFDTTPPVTVCIVTGNETREV